MTSTTLRTDDRSRLTCRDLLSPRTPYAAEKLADGRIVLQKLGPKRPASLYEALRRLGRLNGGPLEIPPR